VDVAPLLRQLVRQGRDDDHDHGWP
jgi:hypothetical protein